MEEKSKMKSILEWIYCILIALVIVLIIKSFIGVPTVVKQSSMYPTLTENQRLWLNKWGTTFHTMPKRGDIITIEAPTKEWFMNPNHANLDNPVAVYRYNPDNFATKFVYYTLEIGKTSYIKRVIGLPGEHVQIKDGAVYINDEKLEEEYLRDYVVTTEEGEYLDIVVPEGTVYVLGDNRGDSVDSRRFGCVPLDKIEGKAVFAFWPLNKFGGIYKNVR